MRICIFDSTERGDWLKTQLDALHGAKSEIMPTGGDYFDEITSGESPWTCDHLFVHETDVPQMDKPQETDLGMWLDGLFRGRVARLWLYGGGGIPPVKAAAVGCVRPIRYPVPRESATTPRTFLLLLEQLADHLAERTRQPLAGIVAMHILSVGLIELLEYSREGGLSDKSNKRSESDVDEEAAIQRHSRIDTLRNLPAWYQPAIAAIDYTAVELGERLWNGIGGSREESATDVRAIRSLYQKIKAAPDQLPLEELSHWKELIIEAQHAFRRLWAGGFL